MTLTSRELAVLECAAEGESRAEIAAALGVSEETVKRHLRHLLEKLEARNRTHAVAIAFRRGLLHTPQLALDVLPGGLWQIEASVRDGRAILSFRPAAIA